MKNGFLRMFVMQYFIIYTASMFATLLFCAIADPDAMFGIDYFWKIGLFSLAADIPILAYYSKKELDRKQFMIRMALHTVLLEAVLLTAGHMIGMYNGWLGGIMFALVVLAVDVFVHWISYVGDVNTASAINEKLENRRMSEQELSEE